MARPGEGQRTVGGPGSQPQPWPHVGQVLVDDRVAVGLAPRRRRRLARQEALHLPLVPGTSKENKSSANIVTFISKGAAFRNLIRGS